MRVLNFVPSLDPRSGGPSRSVPALCRAVRENGVDAVLSACAGPGGTSAPSVAGGAVPFVPLPQVPGTRQLPGVSFLRAVRRAVEDCDLVHVHSLWNPAVTLTALACRRAGVPYLLAPRGMLLPRALRRRHTLKRLYLLLERTTIRWAAALHFLTPAEAQWTLSGLPLRTPFIIVPNGIDPALASLATPRAFRAAYPQLTEKRIMLFCGRLHPSKGLDLQLAALALLVTKFPDLLWVLVGPDEGAWGPLRRRASRMGLTRHLVWTGLVPRHRCLEALADADVFVLTSAHEAHSMALNEALAVGVPIVVTESVLFDQVGAWGAGRVAAGTPESLAAAVEDILAHPSRAACMRQAGRDVARERLAWPKVGELMVHHYHVLAEG